MRFLTRLLATTALALGAAWPAVSADSPSAAPAPIAWKKTVIEKVFRSEGIAIADVNHDGKPDLLVGDFWYEAPNWTAHEIRKPGNYGDGAAGYSECMLCFADDVYSVPQPALEVLVSLGIHYQELGRGGFDYAEKALRDASAAKV